LIGINSAIASETGYYAGYGFAIPINLARTVMTQLIATGHVARAVMGVSIKDATQEDAQAVGLSAIKGVVVRDYTSDDSPAKRAGIQQGDVIISVDGQPVQSVPALQQRVGFKKAGDVVQVTLVRSKGQQQTVSVRLAAAPTGDDETADDESAQKGEAQPAEGPLGISVEPLTQEDVRDPDLRPILRAGGALVVTNVSPEGPAYQKLADATTGYPDIILKVNGEPTRTVSQFRTAVGAIHHGDIATLSVLRRTPDGWVGDVVRLRVP
jgi:serine protease Do